MPATQSNRQVSVKTALADDVLLFANMRGTEKLGRLSEWTVTMESENHNIQIADVLGKPLDVVLDTADGTGKRYFNGVVTRFAHAGSNNNFSIYSATVRPGLWLLSRAANCRIFQDMSVPDIIKQVCGDYGSDVVLDQSGLSQTHPALPYCVQYRETDLDFVCRLMEQSGMYFYFTHTSGRHTTMLADSYTTHAAIPGYAEMKVATARDEESFENWAVSGAITTSKYDVNDFDFEKAASSAAGGLRATASIPAAYGQASYTMYDYPGKYLVAADGGAIAKVRIESEHGLGEEIAATANARGLYPGGLFTLVEHPRDEANTTYLVTSTSYTITGDDYASGDRAFSFACNITAIGSAHAFRPMRTVPQPVVQGPQTAMVVGKAGEEIWTDK